MAILFYNDRIEFGDYTLEVGDGGLVFDGKIQGGKFLDNLQGTVSGYTSGGYAGPPGLPTGNIYATIDKFPFSADGNATDVGDLTQARSHAAGQSSNFSGYTSGGQSPAYINVIDKFPFGSDGNATDVGDLSQARSRSAGQSSTEYGYTSGGFAPPVVATIDKFSFTSDGNASDVGDLSPSSYNSAGQSSTDYGYNSGGSGTNSVIQKFPFASDGTATDVGDLTRGSQNPAGQSSTDYGYVSGGNYTFFTPTLRASNVIDKFPFASDANATDVGDLTIARWDVAGQSSTVSGYTSGGVAGPSTTPSKYFNTIDKFPFASDANATTAGYLTQTRSRAAGQQY